MRTANWYKGLTALLFLGLGACNQQQSSSQNISNCLADPVCKAAFQNPNGTLTAIGTNASGAAISTTPALVQTGTTAAGVPITSGTILKATENKFSAVTAAGVTVSTGSASAGLAAKAEADAMPASAYGARVMSASELGDDPSLSGGSAGAK